MHAETKEAWMEREKARTAVRGALIGSSAFRALQKAYRKLRKVRQAAEDRYLEVCACKLEKFTKTRDMRVWYGDLKGGWKLQEDGKRAVHQGRGRKAPAEARRDSREVETIFCFIAQHDLLAYDVIQLGVAVEAGAGRDEANPQ